MAYFDGCVLPVPVAQKDAYIAHAEKAAALFKKHGALDVVEGWGNDVPAGKTNSLQTAVMLAGDEMPFDGSRLIFGGFDTVVEA